MNDGSIPVLRVKEIYIMCKILLHKDEAMDRYEQLVGQMQDLLADFLVANSQALDALKTANSDEVDSSKLDDFIQAVELSYDKTNEILSILENAI